MIYNNNRYQLVIRRVGLILADIFVINAAVLFALLTRFEFVYSEIPTIYLEAFLKYMIINTVTTLVIFWWFRLYSSLWEYASISEVFLIVKACLATSILHSFGSLFLGFRLPRSTYVLSFVYLVCLTGSIRFLYRFIRTILNERRGTETTTNIMLIGAGAAANVIIREINSAKSLDNSKVVCIIDDDTSKKGRYIHGIKIIGGRDKIHKGVRDFQVHQIIYAIPSAPNDVKRAILNICKETKCELKILPGVYQLVDGQISVKDLRKVEIEDLLGRDSIKVDLNSIMGYVENKVILVTGGGGSIGSELCRQIALKNPKQLIIFDIYENNAYAIQMELQKKYPDLSLVTLIGSVRNTKRIEDVFKKYRPQIVYHAAAHKHVPLMEDSPNEAIKNNVFGTLKTVQAADKYGAEKFVLISTDKAVNPTNIMGASKRICEMIVQAYNSMSKTEFVAVRFGNVLGSNGSVIPLFKKQIEAGGPVTVTHPEIIRYFMTIPEAVSLVLEAGAHAKGGEIFVLDMGEPVKILDLATNLIKLSGYTPGVDMQIKFTGLRPGEKLYEELLMDEEGLEDTDNKLIHIGKPIKFDQEEFFEKLDILKTCVLRESNGVKELVKDIVSTYHYK